MSRHQSITLLKPLAKPRATRPARDFSRRCAFVSVKAQNLEAFICGYVDCMALQDQCKLVLFDCDAIANEAMAWAIYNTPSTYS